MSEFTTELAVKVSGSVISSNLELFLADVATFRKGIKTELVTDDDFVQAENSVKMCKLVETRTGQAENDVLSSMKEVYGVINALQKASAWVRGDRLSLSKSIKTEKNKRKSDIVDKFNDLQKEQIATSSYAQIVGCGIFFENAIKGKRTLESMEAACQELLDSQGEELIEKEEMYQSNTHMMTAVDDKYISLFPDSKTIAAKPHDEVLAIMGTRFAKHDLHLMEIAEAKRIKEEEAKALLEKEEVKTEVVEEEKPAVQETSNPFESVKPETVANPFDDTAKDTRNRSHTLSFDFIGSVEEALKIKEAVEGLVNIEVKITTEF